MLEVRTAAARDVGVHLPTGAKTGPKGVPRRPENEDQQVNRLDAFFLALIVSGLTAGAVYVALEYGWQHAIAYAAVATVTAGVIGGMRR